ncbi:MAG: CopD family protein [Myxococcales bacterium]|nr:MAG: CopD family protein [Myxococcales bacterium]
MQLPSFYALTLWIHILAACLWVGGLWFFVLALLPALRREVSITERMHLIKVVGHRFRVVGWISLFTLLLSGSVILWFRGIEWAHLFSSSFWHGTFGKVLALKLFMYVLVVAFSGLHDFVLGPQATTALRSQPDSTNAQRLRRWTGLVGRANGLLSLLIIFLAIMLVRGWSW